MPKPSMKFTNIRHADGSFGFGGAGRTISASLPQAKAKMRFTRIFISSTLVKVIETI